VESAQLLAECMDEAFRFFFEGETWDKATVRLDADVWSPSFDPDVRKHDINYTGANFCDYVMPVKVQQTYIDERALDDYNKFSKYFVKDDFEELSFV
jgi:hypothetical protein